MRKSKILYISAISLGCALGLFFAGCVKSHKAISHKATQSTEPIAPSSENVQMWHVSPDRVAVLFGYGYNDTGFVDTTVERLYAKYGAAEDGGLIMPIVFPNDFKKGENSIASELPLFVTSADIIPQYAAFKDDLASPDGAGDALITLRGVLLLGAGENTNYAIAHLQDYYGGERLFPVFSLFTQDDILGTEATSDFVLERVQEANVDGSKDGGGEENTQKFVPEVENMIERSIECFCALADAANYPCEEALPGTSLAWDESLLLNVADIASPLSVSRYVDGETGLQSVNHFVIAE